MLKFLIDARTIFVSLAHLLLIHYFQLHSTSKFLSTLINHHIPRKRLQASSCFVKEQELLVAILAVAGFRSNHFEENFLFLSSIAHT